MLTLTVVPYVNQGLKGFLSPHSIDVHLNRHHKAYVDNANKMISEQKVTFTDVADLVKKSEGALFNNAAQHYNHDFFWRGLSEKPAAIGPKTENFLKNEQFSACIRLLEKRGRSISDEKERLSWKVLIESQLAFDSWKHDMASIKGAETKLFEVLGFKGGWMKGCTKPTRKLIQMSIERVAIQLMEIYDSQGMHNRSLSVAAMICHPAKGLLNLFESNDFMNIILRIKKSAVLSYRQNEKIQ